MAKQRLEAQCEGLDTAKGGHAAATRHTHLKVRATSHAHAHALHKCRRARLKGVQVEQRSGAPCRRLGNKAKERIKAGLRTPRFSRDTRRTLPPCSTLLVELTISCLVLYCRYTVFPRTCHAWAAEAQTEGGNQMTRPRKPNIPGLSCTCQQLCKPMHSLSAAG